jgi:hypothetical protein
MKTVLRFAAVLSSGFFLAGGLGLVGIAWLGKTFEDAAPFGVAGLFFMGTAFFVGPILLLAAERLGQQGAAR